MTELKKPKSIGDVINDLEKPKSIEDVLDEMIGANYMLTVAQIGYIRSAHKNELAAVKNTLKAYIAEAYEAGRRHEGARYLHSMVVASANDIDRIFGSGGITE